MTRQCRKVVRNKYGKLCAEPDFPSHGCYFFNIPDDLQDKVAEGDVWLFRYTDPRDSGKKDKRGKPIYYRTSLPVAKLPFDNVDEANNWFTQAKRIIREEL